MAQSPVWLVDRALTSEDEQIVHDSAKETADHWCDHGDPEVVAAGGPDVCTVANAECPESWAEVTGHVDGEAGLPAEAGGDAEL